MSAANPTYDALGESTVAEPDGLYEIVDGQLVEKSRNAFQLWIAARLLRGLVRVPDETEPSLVVPQGLFVIDRVRRLSRRPDVAFVSRERWPPDRRPPDTWAWDVVPDLAVEVISPTNTADDAVVKTTEYLRAGTRLVWVVYTGLRQVYVYDSPTSVRILQDGDELDGGAVLPGFRLPLTDLFGEAAEAQPKP
jgi:Uma2 family endonuclease